MFVLSRVPMKKRRGKEGNKKRRRGIMDL